MNLLQTGMVVQVLLFGISKELVGSQKIHIEISDGATIADFKKELISRYSALMEINSFALALNSCYATDEMQIKSNDEIAIIPPVSGG